MLAASPIFQFSMAWSVSRFSSITMRAARASVQLQFAATVGPELANVSGSPCPKPPATTSTICCWVNLKARRSMREIRSVIIEEHDAGAAEQSDALPVEVARDMLRAVIDQQMASAI